MYYLTDCAVDDMTNEKHRKKSACCATNNGYCYTADAAAIN